MSQVTLPTIILASHPRKGYLAQCIPTFVSGLNGPSAPHTFEFLRREDLGNLAQVIGVTRINLKA